MTIGIIAEYNPFHNGHAYQLGYVRERFAPGGIIVAMSGNFVQRGEPAIFDKYVRAEAALKAGADMVLELPQIYAVSSAASFAASGVRLLDAAGCDTIVCGAEDSDFDGLDAITGVLSDEPDKFKIALQEGLKQGMTFPAAKAFALSSVLPDDDIRDFLSKPNNLLAFEYSFAARTYAPDMKMIMMPRRDAEHNDDFATGDTAPASYLRALLEKGDPGSLREFYRLVPDCAKPLYDTADRISLSDLDTLMYDRLISYCGRMKDAGRMTPAQLDEAVPDGYDPDLSNRLINNLNSYRGISDFTALLKTKNMTYTAVSRMLMQILLDYRRSDHDGEDIYLPYIRVLGRKKEAAGLLSSISYSSPESAVVITALPGEPSGPLAKHIKNDMLYEGIRALGSGTPIRNEYRRKMLVV